MPRFFGGARAALKELFQNAYRAGAQRVDVTLTDTGLVFQDDGTGCMDPQAFLTAGDTGWDEDVVVEPAGLGVFSLLHPDLASTVRVKSSTWELMLDTSTVLNGDPVPVQINAQDLRGCRVELEFAKRNAVTKYDVEVARDLYPFEVFLNEEECHSRRLPKDATRIETSVGTVLAWKHSCRSDRRVQAAWEHRVVEGNAFREAFKSVAKELRFDDLSLLWLVDDASGVRPKLPDRNDLVAGDALMGAAEVIYASITDLLYEHADAAARALEDDPSGIPAAFKTLFPLNLLHRVLADEHDWHHIETSDPAEWNTFSDGESWETTQTLSHVYTKEAVEVGDRRIAESVNAACAMGLTKTVARYVAGAPCEVTELIVEHDEERAPYLALAKSITVDGHALPFLLPSDQGEPATWVQEPQAALQALHERSKEARAIMAALVDYNINEEDAWVDYDDTDDHGHPTVDEDTIRFDLMKDVATHHDPKKLDDLAALRTTNGQGIAAARMTREFQWTFQDVPGDAVQEVEASLAVLTKNIAGERSRLEAALGLTAE